MIVEAMRNGTITVTQPDLPRDWTLAADIGKAVCALLSAKKLSHALYNVAAGQSLTAREIATAVQAHFPETNLSIEDTVSNLVTRAGSLSNARLTADTGFDHWTPFDQGLQRAIDWHTRQEATA